MSPRRKIVSVFLLLLSSAPVAFSVNFLFRQWMIRHEMEEKLEKENLRTVTLSPRDVQWQRSGSELRIAGRLFDVHSVVHHADGSITVKGLYDDDETNLQEISREQQKNNPQETKQIGYFFSLMIFAPSNEHSTAFFPGPVTVRHFCGFASRLSTRAERILTPPPQMGC